MIAMRNSEALSDGQASLWRTKYLRWCPDFHVYRQAGIPVFDYHIFDYFETIFDIQGYNVDAGTDDIDGSDIAEPYDSL